LTIVLSNLLGNAVAYAPDGSAITCGLVRGTGGCSLVVSNPASGLRDEDLDKLTEPFWRASSAREDRTHAGIGLALSRRLAERLSLTLSFTLAGGLFAARLDFPAAEEVAEDAGASRERLHPPTGPAREAAGGPEVIPA
jgi:signal transduction histidine kinase